MVPKEPAADLRAPIGVLELFGSFLFRYTLLKAVLYATVYAEGNG